MTLEEGMRLALAQADLAASAGEVPVGAVIAHGDQVLARAHNMRESLGDPTAHAEMLAIRQAAAVADERTLRQSVMYVTLEPCAMCAGAIRLARLGAVYYGAADERQGCCGSVYRLTEDPALGGLIPASGGILEDECRARLELFFSALRG
ncbi:MAG: nucleoside deaminase [Oscillospiraceae bacterium]|jgi:tRNA(adenine34) deaminase|nr:nucleoside deaminase [Oscillospiraceae bacterium]